MLVASSFGGLLLQFVDGFLVLGVLKTGCGILGVIYRVLGGGDNPFLRPTGSHSVCVYRWGGLSRRACVNWRLEQDVTWCSEVESRAGEVLNWGTNHSHAEFGVPATAADGAGAAPVPPRH